MKNSNKPTPELNAARSEEVSLGHGEPRTPQGKENSKYNSLKHGIFSKVVLLKDEPRVEYRALLKGLREHFQPVGTPEEVLVEKLAMLLWRHRRLVAAERAEIQESTQFIEWDQRDHQQEQAEEIGSSDLFESKPGLIRKIQNPDVLERCLELLAELREGIENDGFNEERDIAMLQKIFGERGRSRLREDLYDTYDVWLGTAAVDEEERKREGYATPEKCKQNVLYEIDREIRSLKRYQKTRNSIEADRIKLEVLRRGVPASPGLDRLLRYEASLERVFDRTLSQLERLQRMRLGQPVLPPVKVQVS